MKRCAIVSAYAKDKKERIAEAFKRVQKHHPEHTAEADEDARAAAATIDKTVSYFERNIITMDEAMRTIANASTMFEI